MKRIKKNNFEVVQEPDGPSFQRAMQKIVDKVSCPKITFPPAAVFVAYVEYTEEILEPETISERYELSGDTHYCGECPHMIRPADKRIRWFRCDVHDDLTRMDSACCDYFYNELEKGVICGAVNRADGNCED